MKLLIIGLDGAPWSLIEKWTDEGKLPFFKELRENGASGPLQSTIPALTSPALPAFYAGKNPGKLGVFDFTNLKGDLVSSFDIQEKTIWEILSENGIKSFIANLRTTYPPKPFGGIIIAGGCPSEESDYVFPKGMKEKVKGFYEEPRGINRKDFVHDKKKVWDFCCQMMDKRYKIARDFLDKYDFSIFWMSETDLFQHFCWDDKNLVLKFYEQVEKILKDIAAKFEGNIIIMSDHGFDEAPKYNFYINSWLKREGFLKIKRGIKYRIFYKLYPLSEKFPKFRSCLIKIYRILKNKKSFSSMNKGRGEQLSREEFLFGLDRAATLAIKDSRSGIKIMGGPPEARLAREGGRNNPDYEKIRNALSEKIKNLIGPDGAPVALKVFKKEELYSGPYVESAPDIIFQMSAKYKPVGGVGDKLFKKRKIIQKGDHTFSRNGIFIAFGPDIKKSVLVKEAEIYDIAPTALHMFGLKAPEDMDGRVLEEIFREHFDGRAISGAIQNRTDHSRDAALIPEKRPYSHQEEEKVKEKLRELGYM